MSDTLTLDAALFEAGEARIETPEAGVWYTLDVAWGLPVGAESRVVRVLLTAIAPSLDIDWDYHSSRLHALSTPGRSRVEMGWNPENAGCFLTPVEAAVGFWRVRFPQAGPFTFRFPGTAAKTYAVEGSPQAFVPPTLSRRSGSPLAPHPAVVVTVAYSGTYPAGGLDFGPTIHGVGVPRFVDVQDTNLYRFVPDIAGQKLRVYAAGSTEVSGAVDFTTQALIFGEVL